MAAKHKVTISWDAPTRSWYVRCSACDCKLEDFGADGLAEQAAERYHQAHGTTIHSIKVGRKS